MSSKKHYLIPIILAAYALLLLIGSTYPFFEWQLLEFSEWFASFESETRYVPRSDFILNILIYIPLGLLISILLRTRVEGSLLLVYSSLIAAGFALGMELIQSFIPSRAHSFIDLLMNSIGSFAGALIHHVTKKHSTLGKKLRSLRYSWFMKGRYAELGMVIIALWALSEISPLAPALKVSMLLNDFALFTQGLLDVSQWQWLNILSFGFEIFVLFYITECILVNKNSTQFIFGIFAGIIIYLKIPVADIQLSPDFFWGLILGIGLYFGFKNQTTKIRILLAIGALVSTYLIHQLNYPSHSSIENYTAFNWLPFDSDAKRINRVTEILNIAWTFLALSFLTLSLKQTYIKKNGAIGLGIVIIVAFITEWQQQFLQHTSADITEVLIAVFAWALPYFHPEIRRGLKN